MMNVAFLSRETVLIAEDEEDILEVMEHNLEKEGYRVLTARDGEAALRVLRQTNPDLVLLDLMLPRVDGLEVCRQLRAEGATRHLPVIMVTAKGAESDVVLGPGVGADDYIVKPFSPRELVARVQAALRRVRAVQPTRDRVARDGLVIDAGRHEAIVDGTPLTLTATEFRLLHWLASPLRPFHIPLLLASSSRPTLCARSAGIRARPGGGPHGHGARSSEPGGSS